MEKLVDLLYQNFVERKIEKMEEYKLYESLADIEEKLRMSLDKNQKVLLEKYQQDMFKLHYCEDKILIEHIVKLFR